LVLATLLLLVLVSIISGTSGGHQATAAAWAFGVLYVGGSYLIYLVLSSFAYVFVSKRTFLTPGRVIGIHSGCFVGIYCMLYIYVELL